MGRWKRRLAIGGPWLAVALVGLAGHAGRGRATAVTGHQDPQGALPEAADVVERVSVLFATNRAREREGRPEVRFSGQRGEPTFGTCEVEFQPIPMMDEIAEKVPFYLPTESSDQQIDIEAETEEFWERLAIAVEATSTGDVALFIHGYSYDFERACDRAAEAQRVLAGQTTVLMFTWPSNGRATDYVSDQTDLEWSVPFLAEVLGRLADRLGPERVHVLAHSLGARAIVQALLDLRLEEREGPLMGRLVLLAPDLDTQTFLEQLPDLAPLTGGITLYASASDTPLKLSRQLNGAPRLGEAGEFLTLAEGMETVDVTPAGRYQILGHEYFYFHPLVVADLVEIVTTGKGAAARAAPRSRARNGLTSWEIAAEERP